MAASKVALLVTSIITVPETLAFIISKPKNGSSSHSLPSVHEVLQTPYQVYSDMDSKLSSFEERLQTLQRSQSQAVSEQKAKYEAKLSRQAKENDTQRRLNKHILQEIANINASNKQLRTEAAAVSRDNTQLQADLELMLSNLTIAEEFVQKTLSDARERMDPTNTSDISVLAELDQQDLDAGELQAHAQKLKAISAIQISADEKPQDLLRALFSSLEDLSAQQNASSVSLREHFDKEMGDLLRENATLLEKQAELNATRVEVSNMNGKLQLALAHLKETRGNLVSRSQAIRTFASRLGGQPSPQQSQQQSKDTSGPSKRAHSKKASKNASSTKKQDAGMSLLQIEGNKPNKSQVQLPTVSKVLEKPRELITTMQTHVGELESRVADANSQHILDVRRQKAQYEQQLEDQAKQNHRLEVENKHLSSDIEALKQSSKELRGTAQDYRAKNIYLREHLQRLLANMSTAHEFTVRALDGAKTKLHNSTELKVLVDLDAQDKARSEDNEHSGRLNEIQMAGKLSMLELSAHRHLRTKHNAFDILATMTATLNELVKEQNASLVALRQHFDEAFKKGEDRHQELLAEQARLNATKAAETTLNQRLSTAATHLQKVHRELDAQRNSLQAFLNRLAGPEAKKVEAKVVHASKATKTAEKTEAKAAKAEVVTEDASEKSSNKKHRKHSEAKKAASAVEAHEARRKQRAPEQFLEKPAAPWWTWLVR